MRIWERLLVLSTILVFVVMIAVCGHCQSFEIRSTSVDSDRSPAELALSRRMPPVLDGKFFAVAAFHASAVGLDGWSTIRCGGQENGSRWLYGTWPTERKISLVMVGEFAVTTGAAYLLKRKGSRWWSLPMLGNDVGHVHGLAHNLAVCQ